MKRSVLYFLSVMSCVLFLSANVAAHCEIPCGIYDDEARINELLEHVSTIEKSMNHIMAISKEKDHDANQLVRWVMNKEDHANQLQHIVTQYFMTQRIKLDAKGYERKLGLLHQMLVYAMKCKQTTDLGNTAKLTAAINEFKALYFTK